MPVTKVEAPTTGTSLDAQLRARINQTGQLSSADVAAAGQVAAPAAPAPVTGEAKAQLPVKEFDDPLVAPTRQPSNGQDLVGADGDELIDVEVSEQERAAFLDALVGNKRFTLPFSIFNGRLSGVIRSRTQDETRAIIAQLQREIREQSITVDADYTLRIRSMLMAAQLATFREIEQPELAKPLVCQRQPDGSTTPPGWLEQAASWQNLDESVATAVYNEIRKFELKYWMMVRHADDQNFWQTAAST